MKITLLSRKNGDTCICVTMWVENSWLFDRYFVRKVHANQNTSSFAWIQGWCATYIWLTHTNITQTSHKNGGTCICVTMRSIIDTYFIIFHGKTCTQIDVSVDLHEYTSKHHANQCIIGFVWIHIQPSRKQGGIYICVIMGVYILCLYDTYLVYNV